MSREESFRAAMSAHGIEYSGELYFDGRLHRFKANGDNARNSWYVLYNGSIAAGAFGCWKRGAKEKWSEPNGSLSQAQTIEVRRRWQEAAREHDRVKAERQKQARKTADWILARARPATTHAYLTEKQVQSHGDLRVYRGTLVPSLRDSNGELHSLQFVGVDGTKKFLTGGRVTGCFFTVADIAGGPLVICEGYATGASIHEATGHAVICAMNSGNLLPVAKAVHELWPQREIIIAADNDQFTDGNPGRTKATAAAKSIGAKLAVPQFHENESKLTDFNDLAIAESLNVVRQQIEAAQVPKENDVADAKIIGDLAALPSLQYERLRKEKASELGCRESVLDKLVQQKRPKIAARALQGHEVQLTEIEPWPEPVDGAKVLDAIAETFTRYIVLPPGAADVAALWCAHTHCFELFLCSPRLNVSSPEKQCGKSTLLDVIALFVPKPVETENLSTAVLFRLIDAEKPVILADEYDSWITSNEELRGILNAGHRQGAMVYRCEGENNEVRGFRAYAPVVLSGIGALPGTLHDRSIVIRLERAKRGELKERFDSRRTNPEQELCRKLARWSEDNRHAFESLDPKMPDGAFNRLADNWRPLYAIAEIAGGDWLKRVAESFARLTSGNDLDAQGLGTLLLGDIAEIFQKEGTDKLPSFELSEMLAAIEGRPWAEWGKHRNGISPNQLAIQLRRFGVFPKGIRVGNETPRGYELASFKEAFDRYLPAASLSECNSATTLGKTPDFEVQHADGMLHPEDGLSQRECCGVAPCTEGVPDLDAINTELAVAAAADSQCTEPAPDPDSELVL